MDTKKVIFIVETTINANSAINHIKKTRAVRKAIKKGVLSIKDVTATRIQNKANITRAKK